MTKEKYKEYIQKQYDYVLEQISGWHESVNVLKSLSDYISDCIDITDDIYNDKDIDLSTTLTIRLCNSMIFGYYGSNMDKQVRIRNICIDYDGIRNEQYISKSKLKKVVHK